MEGRDMIRTTRLRRMAEQLEAEGGMTMKPSNDPTDAKGLPGAEKPTMWFPDDPGQATRAMQESYIELILNNRALPKHVSFWARIWKAIWKARI